MHSRAPNEICRRPYRAATTGSGAFASSPLIAKLSRRLAPLRLIGVPDEIARRAPRANVNSLFRDVGVSGKASHPDRSGSPARQPDEFLGGLGPLEKLPPLL